MDPATASAVAITGQAVFSYNRENFLYDRKLRQKKEFQEMRFRITQAELWRQDVRDIIGLVETKTKLYLLVNMFFMALTVQLWVQGRLPEGTPDWLMLGSQIANVGAFTFMLLTVWLAMHASVSAQGYQARLLTQLVRLPIPTWEELEACRTYASSFEKVEARQMFRVPFLMGMQEDMVSPAIASSPADNTAGSADLRDAADAIDPWGLESRAENGELGSPHNEECAKLRHIKLVRQAAKFFQSYDAFARISMTLGVNQLMLSMSYYILGYVFLQAMAPFAACAGVTIMIASAYAIAKLDMSLGQGKQFAFVTFLVVGPTCSCVAAFHWGRGEFTRFWAPAAFLSNGLLVLSLSWFSQLKETLGGGLLPTSFKQILYLDVFGWISRKYPELEQDAPAIVVSMQTPEVAETSEVALRRRECNMSDDQVVSMQTTSEEPELAHYALDYMNVPGGAHMEDDSDEDLSTDLISGSRNMSRRCEDPALHGVAYDWRTGHSIPSRPQEFVPPSTAQDLRTVPGAPRMWEGISNDNDPKAFFEASSFYPRLSSTAEQKKERAQETIFPIVGGHEHERPGKMPSCIFLFVSILLGLAWLVAASYQLLENNGQLQDFFTTRKVKKFRDAMVGASSSSLLQWSGQPELLDVSFPSSHMRPHGLSCDSSGQRFAITDGLSMFSAAFETKGRLHGKVGLSGNRSLDFVEVSRCESLLGESFEDTAVACKRGVAEASDCDILVLHRRGSRVAECPAVQQPSAARIGQTARLSKAWLQSNKELEKVRSLLLDPTCAGNSKPTQLGCLSVGTSGGRVARLQHSATAEVPGLGELFPDDVMPDLGDKGNDEDLRSVKIRKSLRPGLQRSINTRYVGALNQEDRSVQVLDTSLDLSEVARLTIPLQAPIGSFCAGGGYLYVMSEGSKPRMWRIPLPKDLCT